MRFVRATFDPRLTVSTIAPRSGQSRARIWSVEAGLCPPRAHSPRVLLADGDIDGALVYSVSSSTALRTEFAALFTQNLAAEGCDISAFAQLALHEVIYNSVVHGNLCVSSGPSKVWGDLASRQQNISAALADAAKANRPVTVAAGWNVRHLTIIVADQGDGYVIPPPEPRQVETSPRGAGRGLIIARAAAELSVSRHGRNTHLKFERCNPAVELS